MGAPICRICSKAHWPRDPHIWDKAEKPERIEAARKHVIKKHREALAGLAKGPEKKFDLKAWRRAYMKDYMRRRRKTEREGK